jgi:hypothetical protein
MTSQWPFSRWALEVAAGYFFIIGVVGLAWPWLGLGPNFREFREQSLASRLGTRTRELALSAASVVAGFGLFLHYAWARKLALGLLLIGTIYTANAFARGFSGEQPTPRVRLFSRIAVASWNGLWFYLIYRLVL